MHIIYNLRLISNNISTCIFEYYLRYAYYYINLLKTYKSYRIYIYIYKLTIFKFVQKVNRQKEGFDFGWKGSRSDHKYTNEYVPLYIPVYNF